MTWSLRWWDVDSLQSSHGSSKCSSSILCPLSEILPIPVQILTIAIGLWKESSGGSKTGYLVWWRQHRAFLCRLFYLLPLPNRKEINVQAVNKGKWGDSSVTSGLMVFLLLGNSSDYLIWSFKMLWFSSFYSQSFFPFSCFCICFDFKTWFYSFLRSHAYMQHLRFPLEHLHSLNKYLHMSPMGQSLWPWETTVN